ncbi:hypothetical protein XELAEV_18038375mg [Xenopus laevis]|uniref:Uncharacterized protein n=1 Tax=Xenopus laevis TaxID=8355 RepID=A0A974C5U5_XENLA|nr:hypothetical protein XELAEV_18038375mg [Xenopus laevis]
MLRVYNSCRLFGICMPRYVIVSLAHVRLYLLLHRGFPFVPNGIITDLVILMQYPEANLYWWIVERKLV